MADGVDSMMYEFGAGKSAIREVFEETMALREQGISDFWDFSIGNPSEEAPACVRESIERHLRDNTSFELHGYTPNDGWYATRRAVADNLNARFDTAYVADDVVMTAGCAGAITSTIGALTTAGEEVIVLVPYFPEYRMYIQAWHCICREVPTLPNSFQMDLDAIEHAIGPRTRMIIINSPNNPTGALYPTSDLKKLAALLQRKSAEYNNTIYLLSDEPYREICYEGVSHPWIGDVYPNTIVCYSWSKSLSLPGERVGYALIGPSVAAHDQVKAAILGGQRAVNSICNSLMQRVIVDCLEAPAPLHAYEEKRQIIYQGLSDIGYECVRPDGAFYLWIKCLEEDDHAFCRRAAHDFKLFIVESTDFGCKGWARLSYATDSEILRSSLPQFKALFEAYGGYKW